MTSKLHAYLLSLFHCRLIIIILNPNPNPSPSLSTLLSYNIKEYRIGDKVLISTKDFLMELMKRTTKKLMEKFIGPYVVGKIVSENAVELELLALLRIYLVVNIRRIVKYREQVEG